MPKDRRIIATGIVADQPTASLNIYPREVLDRVVREFNMRARKRPIKGGVINQEAIYELGDPTHITKMIFINDSGMLCAEIEIIDNPKGRKLLDMIDKNIAVAARPIMCIPGYVDEAKKQEHSNPMSIDEINSIVRVQVQCDES